METYFFYSTAESNDGKKFQDAKRKKCELQAT